MRSKEIKTCSRQDDSFNDFRVNIIERILTKHEIDIDLFKYFSTSETFSSAIVKASYLYAERGMSDWKSFAFRFAYHGGLEDSHAYYLANFGTNIKITSYRVSSNRFVRQFLDDISGLPQVTDAIASELRKLSEQPLSSDSGACIVGNQQSLIEELFKLLSIPPGRKKM